ncbi:MAG: Hsp20/alpha crystallin family protein [Pseudomonadota bacterium]
MHKPSIRNSVIVVLGVAAIGALGAQAYYTHELALRVAAQPDADPVYAAPLTHSGQWDPWSDLQHLQAQIQRAFDQSFAAMQHPVAEDAARISLQQQTNNYIVKAVIPGANESDIKVNLDGRLLSISSQTGGSSQQTASNGAVTGTETYSGAFEEAFTLPGPVVAADMKSDFKDGVLTLTIPKAAS